MHILSQFIASKKIPHALLFSGKKLDAIAKQFAIDLIGKYPHPDIHEYFPEGKTMMHPIENLRRFVYEGGFAPYQANWKLFIIHQADRMLLTSANALLKTFEEPTDQTIILLLSSHPEKMLPTILSRCQIINFPSLNENIKHPVIDVLSGEKSLDTLEDTQEVEMLFETILLWYRDRMLVDIEGATPYLSYPDYLESIKDTLPVPLERVESILKQAKLGHERFIRLSTCLETVFYQLGRA